MKQHITIMFLDKKSSDMVLHVHNDDYYLIESKAQSGVGCHYLFYLNIRKPLQTT